MTDDELDRALIEACGFEMVKDYRGIYRITQFGWEPANYSKSVNELRYKIPSLGLYSPITDLVRSVDVFLRDIYNRNDRHLSGYQISIEKESFRVSLDVYFNDGPHLYITCDRHLAKAMAMSFYKYLEDITKEIIEW